MKLNNFRGELTDISAIKEPLVMLRSSDRGKQAIKLASV